jgi:hypothetical protein
MQTEKEIMKVESTLPEDFEGTFYFTNWSDEEFVGKWNSKEYHYPPNSMSPMIIPDASLLDIQQIRKKLAKDLAEREFYKGTAYKKLMAQERNNDGSPRLPSFQQAGTYSLDDMASLIQRGLNPLEVQKATVTASADFVPLETKLSKNDEGRINTRVIKAGQGMRELATKFETE